MKKIILINGKKRHGKDFTAEILEKFHDVEIMRFADPMKSIISQTFGISEENLETFKNDIDGYGIEIKAYPNNQPPCTIEYADFRSVLQIFGTEAMKPVFGNDVWVQAIKKRIDESVAEYILIPDFRFGIELVGLSEYQIYTVKIFNDNIESKDTHASEKELDDLDMKFDLYLDNTGKPNNFEETVLKEFDSMIMEESIYDQDYGEREISRISNLIDM